MDVELPSYSLKFLEDAKNEYKGSLAVTLEYTEPKGENNSEFAVFLQVQNL